MHTVIMISGKARHGKTTLANLISQYYFKEMFDSDKVEKVEIRPIAQLLKTQAKYLGWDGLKDQRGRTFLQQLSAPIKAYHGEDYYLKGTLERAWDDGVDVVIVDDWRLLAETQGAVKFCNDHNVRLFKIRIDRPNFVSDLTPEQLADRSETELDNYDGFDMWITNKNGEFEYLAEQAELIVKELQH